MYDNDDNILDEYQVKKLKAVVRKVPDSKALLVLGEVVKDLKWYPLWGDILSHSKANLALFSRWASSDDPRVRSAVAECTNTPKSVLSKLSDDPSEIVRYKLAENPSTPEDTLFILSLDKSTKVRESVAKNHSANKSTQRFLAPKYTEKSRASISRPRAQIKSRKENSLKL